MTPKSLATVLMNRARRSISLDTVSEVKYESATEATFYCYGRDGETLLVKVIEYKAPLR